VNSFIRVLVGAAVAVLVAAGGGTILASQAASAPVVDHALTIPTSAVGPILRLPATAAAAEAVVAARGAVDDRLAAEATATEAAGATRYTCEPEADAHTVDGFIVNKDCPAINAAKEAAHTAFAEQTWMDGECLGYGCSPEQDAEINAGEAAAQEEYWARCANTPSGVDGC
jgi:hypothetical protein